MICAIATMLHGPAISTLDIISLQVADTPKMQPYRCMPGIPASIEQLDEQIALRPILIDLAHHGDDRVIRPLVDDLLDGADPFSERSSRQGLRLPVRP